MLNLGFISQALQKLLSYFFTDYQNKIQTVWFKRALYVFLLIKCSYLLYYYDLFFGANSIVYSQSFSISPLKDLAFLLHNSSSTGISAYAIVTLMVLCLLQLVYRRIYFIGDFFIWFIVLNLHNKIYPALSGGDYLINQFLLFNCLLSALYNPAEGKGADLKRLFHNIGGLAVMVQMCLAYLLSAMAKVADYSWTHGDAVALASQVNHFSMYSFPVYSANSHWLFVLLNYLVLAYQLAFPLLAWFTRFKKPLLLAGIVMHTYIALVMGLPLFGLSMMIGYIYFWPFRGYLKVI